MKELSPSPKDQKSQPTWRLVSVAEAQLLISALRAMLLCALLVSPLFADSVHRMRSFFLATQEALQSSERPPSWKV